MVESFKDKFVLILLLLAVIDYITDDKIQGTVDTIYNSLVSTDKTFKNLKIVDYFPKEIIDNFDFHSHF